MKEMWKYVPGFEGVYEVSNMGNVRSYWIGNGTGLKDNPERISPRESNTGYRTVVLSNGNNKKTLRVCRLVGLAFVGNPNGKPEVNHKNGIKTDDRAVNIEWCTKSENAQHAYDMGLKVATRGEDVWTAQLTEKDVLEIRAAYPLGCFSYNEISDAYGITKGMVGHIINNRSWKHI